MMSITCYEAATGKILCTVSGDDAAIEATKIHGAHPWVSGDWSANTHYVNSGVTVERPSSPAILTGMVLSQLPNPSTVIINGISYTVTEGTAELEFDYPGTYKVLVESWPHLNKEFIIENQA